MDSEMKDIFDFHEAIDKMNDGCVVQYVGSVMDKSDDALNKQGGKFCMFRHCIHTVKDNLMFSKNTMVLSPDFRFKVIGHVLDKRFWPMSIQLEN
jgi:hypothetical protein